MMDKVAKSSQPKIIKEIKLIGCDISADFAQDIANFCKVNVRTPPNLHSKYDKYGNFSSLLAFNSSETEFLHGIQFEIGPNSSFFKDHPQLSANFIQTNMYGKKIYVVKRFTPIKFLLSYLNGPNNKTVYKPKSTPSSKTN